MTHIAQSAAGEGAAISSAGTINRSTGGLSSIAHDSISGSSGSERFSPSEEPASTEPTVSWGCIVVLTDPPDSQTGL